MITSMRKNRFHVLSGAGLAVAALLIGTPVTVAAETSEANCRQEIRRVAVWPRGGNPKFAQTARVENREVTVCDGKIVSQKPERSPSNADKG